MSELIKCTYTPDDHNEPTIVQYRSADPEDLKAIPVEVEVVGPPQVKGTSYGFTEDDVMSQPGIDIEDYFEQRAKEHILACSIIAKAATQSEVDVPRLPSN